MAGNETWKWSFIVDISACVIVDGLINPTALAWMIGCGYKCIVDISVLLI